MSDVMMSALAGTDGSDIYFGILEFGDFGIEWAM